MLSLYLPCYLIFTYYILEIGFICVISLTYFVEIYTVNRTRIYFKRIYVDICNYSTDIKLGNTIKTFSLRSIFGYSI